MTDFTKETLPPVYRRNNRDCYLDPVRQKLIYITPEETVRQQVIQWLLYECEVPADMIRVEEHLSHYGIDTRRRADIIVDAISTEDHLIHPLVVIECKAPGTLLGVKTSDQMVDYSDKLGCYYMVMTNGVETFCYHYDEKTGDYQPVDGLPPYEKILQGAYTYLKPLEIPERLTWKEIMDGNRWKDYIWSEMGDATPEPVLKAATNLWECLLYPEHRFPQGNYGLFKMKEDLGVRLLEYGNASGGKFSGPYRSFLVEYRSSTEIVSIGLSIYVTSAHQDVNKTVLNVAIDNEKTAHHALQLVLDDNVRVVGKNCFFYHHGRIAVGKIGSGKVDELRAFVEDKAPELISGKQFFLGKLVNDRLWNLDDPEVTAFIKNLISYALIRDEYRVFVKKNTPSK